MTKTERSRIVALGGIGAVIILLVWGIIATLPKKEDGREEEVRLRSEIKDNFTLKDMLGSVEKEMENPLMIAMITHKIKFLLRSRGD